MQNINQNLTTINYTNASRTAANGKIDYLVIHYVGAVSTAKANTDYFKSVYRGASAHYFVDHSSIWQCVLDEDIAWHCGASTYKHKYCRNSNSIGIEMCLLKDSKGNLYFHPNTVQYTIELVRYLMKKYNIPAANVIRHYDVTGKICPEPYVSNTTAWKYFKDKIAA